MDKTQVKEYFNKAASSWDDSMVKSDEKIKRIFDVATVSKDKTILDIACGTGVLVPDYLNRSIKEYVGVDISDEMIKISKEKFKNKENVTFICADAENLDFEKEFDCAVVYNAFPHFVSPQKLFYSLHRALKDAGRVTVAHGMSREALTRHHSGSAKSISNILPDIDEMEKLMSPFFDVDEKISTDEIYIVSGVKR